MRIDILKVMVNGFFLSAGLIIAIGAQNAWVLRQGIQRRRVFLTALVSALGDILLIGLGIGGVGALLASNDLLSQIARWGGFLFLLVFGFSSFRSAFFTKGKVLSDPNVKDGSVWQTIATGAALSLLNPHAWLDTVVVIGGLGAQYAPDLRFYFAVGAMLASVTWFFGLAFGAVRLRPLFEKPVSARVLDFLIGCIMWGIAFGLLVETF